ncbi:DNA polymerase III subunit beta [Brucella rhizosphaerae]|uniref:Beta sliding clamp n=1 Tax=Brucella rhizosphaerae TaxID=571254 RepID=A0A256FHB4_9HYPH|nr:DNA polymerase III subunit beta [Brucella rhizosphaerae]OYR14255.1 DNA polymerase III, beta subunit [Brucella rhizosphaerae]
MPAIIHFAIERRALLPALAVANRAVEKKPTVPILGNVLIQCENGHLTVSGTNLDVEVKARAVQGGISDFPAFTVSSGLLHSAVSKLPDGCEIEFEGDDAVINIRAGRSKLQVPVLPASDFPEIPGNNFPHSFNLPANDLSRALSNVGFAVSTEESRYYLNGIFMHGNEGKLNFVATDGHQFAYLKIQAPDGCDGMPGVIIPRGILNLLSHCTKAGGDTVISLSDRKIRFAFQDGVTVTSKLVDGTYPDYQRIIPTRNDRHYHVDREALLEAVGRVSLVVGEKSDAIKFAFGADDVRLEIENPLAGNMEDAVSLSESHPEEISIGLSYKYCTNVLSAIGSEEVRFALEASNSPCLISPVQYPEAGDPPLFIIMPMR